jgi:DNA repair exonuclease SbcCD nuclease subunit
MTRSAGPLRIAHISDTHLGYRALFRVDPVSGRNQRSLDVEHAYETAVTDMLTRNVDLVVHSGDVFHHTRPSWPALRCFIRQTRRLEEAGLPIIVIGGNHDTPRLRTSGSAYSVLELALPGTTFVTGYQEEFPAVDESLNLHVVAVPHGKLADNTPPFTKPEPGKRNLLITHGLVPGMQLRGHREPGEEEVSDAILDATFDYIALGHYHLWSKQRHNAWYAGSTERMGWGDEDVDPGYLIVELGAPGEPPQVDHIPLPARPAKTLKALDADGLDAREIADHILAQLEKLKLPQAMTRISIAKAQRPVRREAESILRRASADLVWSLQVFSPADSPFQFGERDAEAEIPDLRTLFSRFVKEQTERGKYDQAFSKQFQARGERALDDAIRDADMLRTEDSAA